MPHQIEPLAQKLGIAIPELFRKHLTVDAVITEVAGQMKAIYVLAPAMAEWCSGTVADPTEKGTCTWFKDGKCKIHEVKPLECSLVDHRTPPPQGDLLRASILKSWVPYKKLVQNLYGKKLKPPDALKLAYREARQLKNRNISPG
jgi:Fe-S-cluster containining protein